MSSFAILHNLYLVKTKFETYLTNIYIPFRFWKSAFAFDGHQWGHFQAKHEGTTSFSKNYLNFWDDIFLKVINGGTSIGHCISTLLSVIHFNFEVSEFDITTVQAATDNNIVDGVNDNVDDQNNLRLGRADNNIIPFKNSATMKEINKVRSKIFFLIF